ncbi:MAG: GNAT family N-acetyltransferase [Candidatus Bathyarchaeia archaeon]
MADARGKLQIHLREACNSDREAVFEFCRNTWSWGDYIPRVWDKWLKEKNGKVFVATVCGVPVGISHITLDKPCEAWLSGARTAPNYRRMGVATSITRKCIEYAEGKGAKVVRLVTESTNKVAIAAFQKMGFKPVSEFVEMELGKVSINGNSTSSWADESMLSAVWSYLQASKAYYKAAGLYTVLYHWRSLDKDDLRCFFREGKAIVCSSEAEKVCGLMLVDDTVAKEWRESSIQTCYIDGNFETTIDMAQFLIAHCHMKGIEKVYGFTCNYKPIVTALEKIGFKQRESKAVIFEKRL